MFSARTFILLSIALAFALGAVYLAHRWLGTRQQPAPVAATVPVVVAAADLPQFTRLRESDVKIVPFPRQDTALDPSLPTLNPSYYRAPAEVVGKIVTQTIYANEPLVRSRLRDHLGGSALSHLVTPGLRAVSVRVNDVTGVGGFLLPENRVDVLSLRKSEDGQTAASEVVLQNVKVLAVDQETASDRDKPLLGKTATLELSPADASRLLQAAELGSIQLVLRNPGDRGLISAAPPKPPAPARTAAPPAQAPAPAGERRIVGLGRHSEEYRCGRSGCVLEKSDRPASAATPPSLGLPGVSLPAPITMPDGQEP